MEPNTLEPLLKMDVFFVVTTAVVAMLGILLGLVLFYALRIVRDVSEIAGAVKKEAKEFARDLGEIRTEVKEGVQEIRENVSEGIDTAKTYGKAVAGTGIVKAVSQLLEAFAEEKGASVRRARSRRRRPE